MNEILTPPAAHPAAILFDLDGTLIDSLPDIRLAINRVLVENGRREASLIEIRQGVGHGAGQLVDHCFQITGAPAGVRIADLLSRYLTVYAEGLIIESKLYPGVVEMLRGLQKRGHPLGICTNKPEKLAVRLLQSLGLADYFSAIVGGDTVPRRKPHGDHLLATLAAMKISRGRALVVGDSENDVAAARAAGMPVAAVRFGYAHAAPEALGADVLINSFTDFYVSVAEFL